jgi:predicted transcriptional regulator
MTIGVEADPDFALKEAGARFVRGWETGTYQGEASTFSSVAQLFEVLPPRRWELLARLREIGPSTLRGLARALGRDVKRVHEDVAVLLAEGLIERGEDKKLVIPFERIHIDADLFTPSAAAE